MKKILFLLMLAVCSTSFAQSGKFKPDEAFAPLFSGEGGISSTRSQDGRPGRSYWQNAAFYRIRAHLDTVKQELRGGVEITYTNNSGSKLGYLWLQLDQNYKKHDSRFNLISGELNNRRNPIDFTDGFELRSVKVKNGRREVPIEYLVNDTRMKVMLPRDVKGRGGKVTLKIEYSFLIPEHARRMGRMRTKYGSIYELAQWYPRMAVYDDVNGWNTLPYLPTDEFYLDYAGFDVQLSLPGNMIAVATGKLANPREVLSVNAMERLKAATNSDSTVMIRTKADVEDNERFDQMDKTWHFKADNVRDFAWAASASFIWDAAKVEISDKKVLAMSVYPVESVKNWSLSTQLVKRAILSLSNKWFPYPYPCAINAAGPVFGMEYPGLTFCSATTKLDDLKEVTFHEMAHQWFPMIVGSNERVYPWMDEGFATFIQSMDSIGKTVSFPERVNYSAAILNGKNNSDLSYIKTSVGLSLLRNTILGPERFDPAFKAYIAEWAFKHPTPWDFFRSMNNGAGEDLSWFWRGWFLTNSTLDQGVTGVDYVDEKDPKKGCRITIVNLEPMAMPVVLQIKQTDGKTGVIKLPVEIWQNGSIFTFWCPLSGTLSEIVVDSGERFPDQNRANNYLKLGGKVSGNR